MWDKESLQQLPAHYESHTVDNLDDVRDTQTQAVDAIFRPCGRKLLTSRKHDSDQRVLLRDRILHATDARFQHLTFVTTDLQTRQS